MSSLTKADLAALADEILSLHPDNWTTYPRNPLVIWQAFKYRLMEFCSERNKRFDREKFILACSPNMEDV